MSETSKILLEKPKLMWRQKWRLSFSHFLFLLPVGAMWLVFAGYPFVRGLIIPFQDYRWTNPQSWSPLKSFCGLANFREVFKDPQVLYQLRRTTYVFLAWFPITFVLSLFLAAVLAKIRAKKLSVVYRLLITLPWILFPLAGIMFFFIFDPEGGYLNHFLSEVIKIWKNPPIWVVEDTFWEYIWWGVTRTWTSYGFFMLIFLIGFYNIPQEQYEAVRLDGANVWQEFWHVSLPGIRNLIFLFLLLNAGFFGVGVEQMMGGGWQSSGFGGVSGLNWYGMAVAQGWFGGDMRMGYGAAIMFSGALISVFFVGLLFKFFKVEKA